MEPLVSIIIPAHNAEPWLEETLRSCLAQTWPHLDVTVVDDGSTDHTGDVARRWVGERVKLITQPQRGASAARNAGLREARGDYIQFLDADDLLDPAKITEQVRTLEPRPGRVASGRWARFESDPATAVFSPQPLWRDLTGVEFLQLRFETVGMMHPAAWLVPRSLLERVGEWNEDLTLDDDGEFFARVVVAAEGIVFCAGARTFYRSNLQHSLSRRRDPASLRSWFKSVELTVARLLAADSSPRSRAAAAYAWKWTAFEVYPELPDAAREAEERCRALGGSNHPLPVSRPFQVLSRLLGWRQTKRLQAAWRSTFARRVAKPHP